MVDKLKSRKLLAFVFTVLLHILNGYLGNPIDDETMQEVTKLALGYIVGQGLADLGKEGQVLASLGTQIGHASVEAMKKHKEEQTTSSESG